MFIKVVRRLWAASPPRGEGSPQNLRNNPRQKDKSEAPAVAFSRWVMHQCPRCGARTRRGTPCQSPAMANGRCRMHGGMSPGAPKGNKNALRHGRYTAESIAVRRLIARLAREARKTAESVF
jgi:hypothetical protein